MISGFCNVKQYLGVDFTIWANEGAWFWCLIDAKGRGGMIGASANEAQATEDARISIEEKLAVCS